MEDEEDANDGDEEDAKDDDDDDDDDDVGGGGGRGRGGSLSPGRSGIRGPARPFASQSKTQGSPLGGYLSWYDIVVVAYHRNYRA